MEPILTDTEQLSPLHCGRTAYQVQRVRYAGNLKHLKPVYLLTGARGAAYGLIRCQNRPEQMFAMNLRRVMGGTPFDGYRFTDTDGTLRLGYSA